MVLDAQLPRALSVWLREVHKVDAVTIFETGLARATDEEIFRAWSSPGDVIATKDEDFVDLVTRLGSPPQVLWIRLGNCTNHALRASLASALPRAFAYLRAGEPVVEIL